MLVLQKKLWRLVVDYGKLIIFTSLAAPPLLIIVEGSGVSSIKQLYESQGFLLSNGAYALLF